jgi:hypothetical protein
VLRKIAKRNNMPCFSGMLEGEKLIGYTEEDLIPDLDEKQIDASSNSLRGPYSYTPTMAGYVSVSECNSESKRKYNFAHLMKESTRINFYTVTCTANGPLELGLFRGPCRSLAVYSQFGLLVA